MVRSPSFGANSGPVARTVRGPTDPSAAMSATSSRCPSGSSWSARISATWSPSGDSPPPTTRIDDAASCGMSIGAALPEGTSATHSSKPPEAARLGATSNARSPATSATAGLGPSITIERLVPPSTSTETSSELPSSPDNMITIESSETLRPAVAGTPARAGPIAVTTPSPSYRCSTAWTPSLGSERRKKYSMPSGVNVGATSMSAAVTVDRATPSSVNTVSSPVARSNSTRSGSWPNPKRLWWNTSAVPSGAHVIEPGATPLGNGEQRSASVGTAGDVETTQTSPARETAMRSASGDTAMSVSGNPSNRRTSRLAERQVGRRVGEVQLAPLFRDR